jgi:hypothetical protein
MMTGWSQTWTVVPPTRRQLRQLHVLKGVLDVGRKNACCINCEHHRGPPSKRTRHQSECASNFANAGK